MYLIKDFFLLYDAFAIKFILLCNRRSFRSIVPSFSRSRTCLVSQVCRNLPLRSPLSSPFAYFTWWRIYSTFRRRFNIWWHSYSTFWRSCRTWPGGAVALCAGTSMYIIFVVATSTVTAESTVYICRQ